MALQVSLDEFSIPEHEIEQITVVNTKGEPKRVGFCSTRDGASPYFVRILPQEQRDEIVGEVTRIRAERGLATGDKVSQPPDPDEIRKALKKDKAK